MRREIKRLEIQDGIHLEGIGVITKVLPMAMKHVAMRMFYDTTYPSMVIVESGTNTHFISLSEIKSGTFDGEPDGNVV